MHSEQDLVRRARTGDQAAFSALVTAYEGRIYMLALRYLGNRDDAQDAAQEVFLRVFRFLDGFQAEFCLPSSCPTSYPVMSHGSQPTALPRATSRLLFSFILLCAGHVRLRVLIDCGLGLLSLVVGQGDK